MGDVTDDYGRKVGMALNAVRQLYADTSRLLSDCDGVIGKGKSVATRTTAVTDTFSSFLQGRWMAQGAYRCYAPDPVKQPGLVDAVCLCFIGEPKVSDEPLLIAGQISYLLDPGQELQRICDGWDLWYLFACNCPNQTCGEVLSSGPITWEDDGKVIDWFKLIAVPLYSINSADDVAALLGRIRATAMPSPTRPFP